MIREYLENNLTDEELYSLLWQSDETKRIMKMIDNSIIDNSFTVALPSISEISPMFPPMFTKIMYDNNLGEGEYRANFASFTFKREVFTEKEIELYRTHSKLDEYIMRIDDKEYISTLVKRNGKIHKDGAERPGMMIASKRRFMIDTPYLKKYQRAVKQNLIKGIKKGIDSGNIKDKFLADPANHRVIIDYVVSNYLDPTAEYNSEYNVQDQRGRAIKNVLKRIGNYIASKDFRAMIKIPEAQAIKMTKHSTVELEDIYYFIAELTGKKCLGQTEACKIEAGRQAYLDRELPRLDLKSEHGRDELHELIWLERIYAKLDKVFAKSSYMERILSKRVQKLESTIPEYEAKDSKWHEARLPAMRKELSEANQKLKSLAVEIVWDIPLEIDHSMSLAQIIGALTNDKRLLESTSVIGDTISDPWHLDGIRRNSGKFVGTPTFYGSSQSPMGLLKAKKQLFEQILEISNPDASEQDIAQAKAKSSKEIQLIKKEFSQGRFGILNQFKNLMIKNFNMHKPIIDIDTGISTFKIHVNKFKTAGMQTITTKVWNGKKYVYAYTRKPILVPDYERMKLFWATGIVHHLDSDLMEHGLYTHLDKWLLDIHDAVLALPGHARKFRETQALRVKFYNKNRFIIMDKYQTSIGATTPKAKTAYYTMLKSVVDAGDVPFTRLLMK